jgi:hypothetical protein
VDARFFLYFTVDAGWLPMRNEDHLGSPLPLWAKIMATEKEGSQRKKEEKNVKSKD